MAIFNTDTFLDDDAGDTMSTERVLIPADTYSPAFIKDIKPMEGIIKNGDRSGEPWAGVTFTWVIDDADLQQALDRKEVQVRQMLMLDLTPDGKLDEGKGKNVRLGRLRAALGINEGKVKWREFLGVPATITIKHVDYQGKPQEDVSDVAGL